MRFLRNILPGGIAARLSERRQDRRLRLHWVACSVGEVVDFSASGIRVAISAKHAGITQGQKLDVRIDGVGGPFTVAATVIWVRSTGRRQHEAGLRFEGMTPESRAHLAALARAPEVGYFGAEGTAGCP